LHEIENVLKIEEWRIIEGTCVHNICQRSELEFAQKEVNQSETDNMFNSDNRKGFFPIAFW